MKILLICWKPMNSTINCIICGKEYGQITGKHVKSHNISLKEYIERYPSAKIISDEALHNKRNNISSSKKGTPAPNKNTHMSAEQKLKLSISTKGRRGSRSGAMLSDTTKEKISISLTGKELTIEHKAALKNAIQLKKDAGTYTSPIKKGTKLTNDHREQAVFYLNKANENKTILANSTLINRIEENNLKLLSRHDDRLNIQCNICSSEFSYDKQIFDPCRRHTNICPICFPRDTGVSLQEKEVVEFVKSIYSGAVIENDRSILSGKELDIFIPEFSLAIEFCGLYWHSYNQTPDMHKFHIKNKTEYAFTKDINVITIFSDEWEAKRDIVKSRLSYRLKQLNTKIHARKCEIRKISAHDKNLFLRDNHLQGSDISSIRYGAFCCDELVAVMTFTKSNMSKGGDGSIYELNRFACKNYISISGIANKLFLSFVREYSPDSIISYSDLRWGFGDVYKSMGFQYTGKTPPNYFYTNDYKRRQHRSVFMKHRLTHLLEYDANLTEMEIMKKAGYDWIYDAGHSKWLWKNKPAF